MQEINLIDGEIVSEPRINNAPVVVNEVDTNLLNIATEDELSNQLGCECRMNKDISLGVKETSYKCPNCPDGMKSLCLFCLENCHKSHLNNLPSDLFKGEQVDFQKTPCECALHNHKASVKKENLVHDNKNKTNCPFNKLFALVKPKYYYRRKENNKVYCLYCIHNYSIPITISDESSSLKGSKLSAFGSIIRKSIQDIENEDRRTNAEKENVSDDKNFYAKYDKIPVDYSKPFPDCECVDDLHKHQIMSENIDNLCQYMTYIVEINKINLDKLSYQVLNNDKACDVLFSKLTQIHETIYNSIKDIEDLSPELLGDLGEDSNYTDIDLDDKVDWEIYIKSIKLIELATKRLKIFNFFGLKWISENYKKYFEFKTLSKLLQCRSNIEGNFFKLQLFTTRIYRQSNFMNIPHILLNNENMSFINRQLFCSTGSRKTESLFDEGNKIVEKIFCLLDRVNDNPDIDPKDYNGLFIEALKILKTIIPYRANDINMIMNLFRKIENNLGNVKEKKENQNKVIHSLEKIIEKVFSYFNDNTFVFGVKKAEIDVKYNFSFLSSADFNKELLSTLFNFDEIEINENNPFITVQNFYDGLLSEHDSYAETIENFINADEKWLKKINKDYNYIFHGASEIKEIEEVKDFFNIIVEHTTQLLNNKMTEFEFLKTTNHLLTKLVISLQAKDNTFKEQASFFQNKYFIKMLFLICLESRISKFASNEEMENSEEKNRIDSLSSEIFYNFNSILQIEMNDNPLAGSLLFSRIAITLLIRDKFEDMNIYINILKMMKKYNFRVNTYFLTSHIHTTFQEKMVISEENNNNMVILLNIYKLILTISSNKSILQVNNIISSDLKYILENQNFKYMCDYLEKGIELELVENLFKCVHLLQNEYFYVINQFIDIKKIIEKLKENNLNPRIRKIFTQIHTDYFVKNYFSTITIQTFFQNENLISSNLVENLSNTNQQKELQEFLTANDVKSQLSESEEDNKMSKILDTIFNNLQSYRIFHTIFIDTFQNNFKFTVSFFKNLILYPTIYSVYKLTYFPKNFTAFQKYDLFKLIFAYYQSFQYFLQDIVPKYNLESEENAEIWNKLFVDNVDIEEIKENLNKSIQELGLKSVKILDIKFLLNNFVQNSKCFKIIENKFLSKGEDEQKENEEEKVEEDEDFEISFYNLGLDMNLFKRIKKELVLYKEKKKLFEGSNIFDEIFQDDNLEVVQKTICKDLLNKLLYKKGKSAFRKQEHIGYTFQSDIIRGPQNQGLQKRRSLFTGIYKGRRGARASLSSNINDKTDKYGEFYNPYLSPFLEEKSTYYEIIDKLFKVNPTIWQEKFVDTGTNGRDLIYNIIMKQLPFLLQFIFIEFNKIDTKESRYYEYFLNVLEFLRLLCEDHNPLFQTMFINYEKAIGKISLLSNDNNIFMPFIGKIPIFVLLNIKHNNSKKVLLKAFTQKEVEYFYPLIEKITDFLIEIIQGTYPENFNDLTTSIDEVSCFGIVDNIKKHYQFLDYLDTDISYESFINYFFKFFNCFVEEGANPMSIKVPIMNIFHPKKLLNISINAFKNCIHKYVGDTIKEGCSEELIQIFIKDYDNIMEDTSFSLFLTLFLYIKRANSFKDKILGDKYQEILDTLKELEESDEVYEENSIFLLKKEYYKFCSSLTRETEISFVEDKSKEDKELFKYRDFFSSTYMKEVIEFRNKNCAKIQNFENVFFLVHPDSLYIKEFDTDLFLQKATYDNFNTKLSCILDYYPKLNQLIEMRKTLSKNMLELSQINYINMELISAAWAIATNVCFAFHEGKGKLYYVMMFSVITHIIFLGFLILNWFVFEYIKKSKSSKDGRVGFPVFFKLLFSSLINPEVFPFLWSLTFGVLGCISQDTHFLFCLQLFPIFTLFDMMRNVLDAIKARYNQFLSTLFLIIILILFSSAITFHFFNYNSDGGQLCTTYLHCFIYLFNYGLRGGGLPFEIKIFGQEGFWGEFIFNWMFYFILILVILNIAAGIIVDKFHDLREKNEELYEEKENVCFICSLHRSNFEIKGIDFEYHQKQEHNIENYFHYLMKINRTDEHDLNSIDFQVYNAYLQNKIVFFPIKKAKSLED